MQGILYKKEKIIFKNHWFSKKVYYNIENE